MSEVKENKAKKKVPKQLSKLNNKNALKPINENQVYKLAQKRWTVKEIAAFFDCAVNTITSRFETIILKGHENYNTRLREAQTRSAMNGNVTMQIWLGKQYLDQVDKVNTNGLTDEETERLRQIAKNEMLNNL